MSIAKIPSHIIGKFLEEERNLYDKILSISTEKKRLEAHMARNIVQRFLFSYLYAREIIFEKYNENWDHIRISCANQTKDMHSRFLLELFLTSLDILSKESIDERYKTIYALVLSHYINQKKNDLIILENNTKHVPSKNKLNKNKKEYSNFVKNYPRPSRLIPEDIDVFFPLKKYPKDPLRNREKKYIKNGIFSDGTTCYKLEKQLSFSDEFGFQYYNHGKPTYKNIIYQNKILQKFLDELKKEKLINAEMTEELLTVIYSLTSESTHPTIGNIFGFNELETYKVKPDLDHTFENLLGILMLKLCVWFRTERLKTA